MTISSEGRPVTRRQVFNAATTDERYLRIMFATVNHNSVNIEKVLRCFRALDESVLDRLDKFILKHKLSIRQASQRSFTNCYYTSMFKTDFWTQWMDDLDNHFDALRVMLNRDKDAHLELDVCKALIHYRQRHPGVMTTLTQESAVLKMITLMINRHAELRVTQHKRAEAYSCIALVEPELFRLAATYPESVDAIFDIFAFEEHDRFAVIEARVNGVARSPLNVGAL